MGLKIPENAQWSKSAPLKSVQFYADLLLSIPRNVGYNPLSLTMERFGKYIYYNSSKLNNDSITWNWNNAPTVPSGYYLRNIGYTTAETLYENQVKLLNENYDYSDLVVYIEFGNIGEDFSDKIISGVLNTYGAAFYTSGIYTRYLQTLGTYIHANFNRDKETTLFRTTPFDDSAKYADYYYIKELQYYCMNRKTQVREKVYCAPMAILNVSSAYGIKSFTTSNFAPSQPVIGVSLNGGQIQICLPARNINNKWVAQRNSVHGTTTYSTINSAIPFNMGMRGGICYLNSQYADISDNIINNQLPDSFRITGNAGIKIFPFGIETVCLFPSASTVIQGNSPKMSALLGDYSMAANANETWVSKDKNEFYRLFADWNIPVVETIEDAEYKPFTDFDLAESPTGGDSGYIPDMPTTGIDTDIPEDIPKDDTNKIDDFTVVSPNLTASNLCKSYIYNYSEVIQLFNWFCTTGYIENQSELFADKLAPIYGLMLFPFDLVNHDPSHVSAVSSTTIVAVTENIAGYSLNNGYNTIINGGELTYLSYYGNFADWTACKYALYIPYAGITELPANCVVNKRLTVQYSLDLMTGKATAIVKSYDLENTTLGVIVKLIPCQIGHLVPVQSSNYAQREISNTLSFLGIAQSGINGVMNLAQGVGDFAGGIMTGNAKMAASGGHSITSGALSSGMDMANRIINHMFSQQLVVQASGIVSPTAGFGLPQTPFLSVVRARQITPQQFQMLNGFPTSIDTTIGAVSTGSNYIVAQNFNLDIPTATNAELNEIATALKSGIYV